MARVVCAVVAQAVGVRCRVPLRVLSILKKAKHQARTSEARSVHSFVWSDKTKRYRTDTSESGASPAKCLHAVGVSLGIRCGSVMSRLSKPHHLPAGLFPCCANAAAIFSATEGVPA